ncbi:MAG: Lrp/AsnC family transcriptional regulator [Nanoarchaeota archaeon]|nr:Lrp/AsnC family transcriptional regulator [Nanoarchaeota archaeon]
MKPKTGLRKAEKLILSRLELDSRVPFSRFARKIGKSQQVISYTVTSMIERKVIRKFYTIIDYSKLDILNFRVYFKVSYINKEKIEELVEFLVSETHTSWIATCGGRYDIICTFMALNPSQFNKTLRNIMQRFPEQLQNYIVLTTVVNRIFGRKYLFKNASIIPEIIVGGDRRPEKIDALDMEILDEIAEDARKNSVAISSKVDLTSKSVIERIKKLQERLIIRGFRPLLDLRKMGYLSNILLIKYHNISVDMETDLIEFLKAHPNIASIVKTLGEWDIEIYLETPDQEGFRKVEMEIRQRFAALIQEIESVPLYKTHKVNYFPKFLIKDKNKEDKK